MGCWDLGGDDEAGWKGEVGEYVIARSPKIYGSRITLEIWVVLDRSRIYEVRQNYH